MNMRRLRDRVTMWRLRIDRDWYMFFRYCWLRKHVWFLDGPPDPSVGIFGPTLLCENCGACANDKQSKEWEDSYDPTPMDGWWDN